MKNKKPIIITILVIALVGAGFYFVNNKPGACQSADLKKYQSDKNDPVILIQTDKCQNMILRLNPEVAPNTVANFVQVINDRKLDETNFFRIIFGFMIQGGEKKENAASEAKDNQGQNFTIKGEFKSNGFDQNNMKHERGVISMARSAEKDSAAQQYFIVHKNGESAKSLDGEYAAFGKIVDDASFTVLDELARAEVAAAGGQSNEASSPVVPPVVKAVTVETFGKEYKPERIYSKEKVPSETVPAR